MKADKPLSKTAQLRADRQARRAAKEAKRTSDAARLAAARDRAAELSKAMPADYQNWGVTRIRAFVNLIGIVQGKAQNATINPDALEGYLRIVDRASQWSLPYCQHLSELHSRSVDVSAPEGLSHA